MELIVPAKKHKINLIVELINSTHFYNSARLFVHDFHFRKREKNKKNYEIMGKSKK